jgi:CheY-like chemotaxis protein
MLDDGSHHGAPRASGRVLVVDDDAAVGSVIKRALQPLAVTFAQSAAGALARVAAGGNFEAIVCDLNMPGMTGIEFHDEVAKISVALAKRIVFVTGDASAPAAVAFRQRTSNICLEKPFARAELQAAVAAAARRSR